MPDTSTWIGHSRSPDKVFDRHLCEDKIAMHPFVAKELALGSLRNRKHPRADFKLLPQMPIAGSDEVMYMIDAINAPIAIEGLWGLAFGSGSGPANSPYFTASPEGEQHGLFGTITTVENELGGDHQELITLGTILPLKNAAMLRRILGLRLEMKGQRKR